MKRISLATLIACVWLLAGCNTMQGLGQDVQKTGEALEDAASKKK